MLVVISIIPKGGSLPGAASVGPGAGPARALPLPGATFQRGSHAELQPVEDGVAELRLSATAEHHQSQPEPAADNLPSQAVPLKDALVLSLFAGIS